MLRSCVGHIMMYAKLLNQQRLVPQCVQWLHCVLRMAGWVAGSSGRGDWSGVGVWSGWVYHSGTCATFLPSMSLLSSSSSINHVSQNRMHTKRAPRDKKVKRAKDVLLLSILENCLHIQYIYICTHHIFVVCA